MTPTAPLTISQEKSATWSDFIIVSENTSACTAIRRLLRTFTHPQSRLRIPNPLLFHGGTGSGKSFLVQTMVRELIASPHGNTIQVLFAGEIQRATDENTAAEDLTDARTCDLLVIEDLQQLPLRSSSVFNHLLDERLRRRLATIITANHGPAGLKSLPRRLTSRLASGLIVQLEPLRVRSRETMLRELAARRKLTLAPEAIEWLARHGSGSGIRPLIGMLEQLRSLTNGRLREWNLAEVQTALNENNTVSQNPVEQIVHRVAAVFGVKPKDLLGSCRQRAILLPRQVAMYLAREAKLSLVAIGTYFGGRDHTTVMHACKKITEAMKVDAKLRRTVRDLRVECR